MALAVQMAGYVPTESLAVVTIRSKQVGPVAVVKLPTTADLTWTVAETLTGMLQRHADAAVLVVFTERPQAWAQPVQQLAEQLDRAAEASNGNGRIRLNELRLVAIQDVAIADIRAAVINLRPPSSAFARA